MRRNGACTTTASTCADDPALSTNRFMVNPSPRTITLVRHGETKGNIEDRANGHLDEPLSELGRRQAEAVGKRLAGTKFDAIYASDLQRAVDTARAITKHHPDLPIQTRPSLREYHFGDYEDMLWDEVCDAEPEFYGRWKNLNTRVDIEFPGGESIHGIWNRVGACLEEIVGNHQDENARILIVAHGGALQAVFAQILKLPIANQWCFMLENTSVTELYEHRYTPDTWRVGLFNDTSHLNGIGHIDRSKR